MLNLLNLFNTIVLPCCRKISNALRSLLRKIVLRTIYRILFKSNRTIQLEKDIRGKVDEENVIYKIKCKSCNAVHKGKTRGIVS